MTWSNNSNGEWYEYSNESVVMFSGTGSQNFTLKNNLTIPKEQPPADYKVEL